VHHVELDSFLFIYVYSVSVGYLTTGFSRNKVRPFRSPDRFCNNELDVIQRTAEEARGCTRTVAVMTLSESDMGGT
jgi:hypothetical protein